LNVQVDTVMDAWKWWFGGIIFFTVTFCVAKCLLCPGRNHVQRARGGGLDTTQNGVDMQPVHAFEVTTNKHAPTVLRKIGGSLYRRIDEPHPQTCTAPPDAQDATRPPPDDPAGAAPPAPVTSSPDATAVQSLACDLVFQERESERASGAGSAGGGGEGQEGREARVNGVQDDEMEGDDLCCVCLDGRNEAVLLECGHGGLCVVCAQVIFLFFFFFFSFFISLHFF